MKSQVVNYEHLNSVCPDCWIIRMDSQFKEKEKKLDTCEIEITHKL